MARPIYFSALTFITLSSVVGAWGQGSPSSDQRTLPPDLHFPFHPEQAWAVEESLLVWRPSEDALDYAVRSTLETESSGSQSKEVRLKHPDFKWGTGVRLKLTRYLPSSDPWDIDLIGTYYYSGGHNDVKVKSGSSLSSGSSQDKIESTWETAAFGVAPKARSNVRMNFFNFDLLVGRHYCLTRKIDIHPFIGIRSVLLYQDYKASYFSSLDPEVLPLRKTSFKGENSFWGVGPRIGADLSLHLGRHWSLLSTFGGSFFAGRSHVQEKIDGSVIIVASPSSMEEKIKTKDSILRSNLDASIGLGWEKWVRNKTVRIAPSLVFEVSEWFAIKRWVDAHSVQSADIFAPPAVQSHRRYSDLGLMGFNINLQIDF